MALRTGGRLAFYTIGADPGRTPADAEEAKAGPSFARTERSYRELLETAGFVAIEERDVTAAYRSVAARWLEHATRLEAELRQALGHEAFEQRQSDRRRSLQAISEGYLCRSLWLARTS